MTPIHTPGPWGLIWQRNKHGVIGKNPTDESVGRVLAIIANGPAHPEREPVRKANARIMSAAPDMLAALEDAIALYGNPGGPWNVPSDPGGWLDKARKAVAKARGKRKS